MTTRVAWLARPINGSTSSLAAGSRLARASSSRSSCGRCRTARRDRDPLHHAAAEQTHRVIGASVHLHRGEDLLHAGVLDAVQAGLVAQVLAAGQVPVQERLVSEQPDPAADGERPARQPLAVQLDLAGVRAQQRRQDAQQRRLAGPVAAEDGDGRARLDAHRHIPQRRALPEVPGEAAQLNGRGFCHPRAAASRRRARVSAQ